jgi:hypothetical protein
VEEEERSPFPPHLIVDFPVIRVDSLFHIKLYDRLGASIRSKIIIPKIRD